MINSLDIISIENLLNKKIINSKLLSDSFNINCIKITTDDNINYIAKFYKSKSNDFNAIKSETKNLLFFESIDLNFFPKVCAKDNNFLIMSYIDNNRSLPNETNNDFLNAIISMHSLTSNNYGFGFDTQIGGLRQSNNEGANWVDFYREKRLGYIFNLINSYKPMENIINEKIEFLLKNLENYIPNNPKISLLHGDLWEGNILFLNKNFSGFIDPGSFYGHNEMEVAYLRWFNPKFIDKNFLDKYNEKFNIDNEYLKYENIYQLYYSLLNVYLWDRSYVNDVYDLLHKIKF